MILLKSCLIFTVLLQIFIMLFVDFNFGEVKFFMALIFIIIMTWSVWK